MAEPNKLSAVDRRTIETVMELSRGGGLAVRPVGNALPDDRKAEAGGKFAMAWADPGLHRCKLQQTARSGFCKAHGIRPN